MSQTTGAHRSLITEKLAEFQKMLADIGPADAMIRCPDEIKKVIHESQCGNRDVKIRDRYYGVNDPLANKMIAKMKVRSIKY